MLVETCFLLWCETQDSRICTIQRAHYQLYTEHVIDKEYRQYPQLENGEIRVVHQKLNKKLGCWLERIND